MDTPIPCAVTRYDFGVVGEATYRVTATRVIKLPHPPWPGLGLFFGAFAMKGNQREQLEGGIIRPMPSVIVPGVPIASAVAFDCLRGRYEAELISCEVHFDRLDDMQEAYAAAGWKVIYLGKTRYRDDQSFLPEELPDEVILDRRDERE